jgi:predicted kinase
MHGFTAVGKSTVAKYLYSRLANASTLHTAVIRQQLGLAPGQPGAPSYDFKLDDRVFTDEVSKKVYGTMAQKAEGLLQDGKSVILDGTYNFIWQRQQVYDLSHRLGVPLVVIHCVCSDENEVKNRLAKRAHNPATPFAETNEWETYLSTKQLSDPIAEDSTPDGTSPHILRFDTKLNKLISVKFAACVHCQSVAAVLDRLNESDDVYTFMREKSP